MLVAVAVGATSFAIANQTRKPALVMALKVPPQGLAQAGVARTLYGARLQINPKAGPGMTERRLAGRAFASEPFAANALPVLIAGLASDGQHQKADELLQFAGRMTRRDRLINAMLIDRELLKNRPERLIHLFSRAMAVSREVRGFYLERLATATATPGALRALVPILGRAPDWSAEYWGAVVLRPQAVPQAGALRLRIAGPPWNQRKIFGTDPALVRALVEAREFETASALAHVLGLNRDPAETLVNSSFSRIPRFPPIDWDLLESGEIGVNVDRSNGGKLQLSSLPSSNGVVARQLVALSPGRYKMSWKVSGLNAAPGSELRFRLACIDSDLSGGQSLYSTLLGDGAGSKTVDVRPSACRWFWTTIELNTMNVDSGVDVTIDQISLRREEGGHGQSDTPPDQV